jgi:indole-3-glycerol phosphate synthase
MLMQTNTPDILKKIVKQKLLDVKFDKNLNDLNSIKKQVLAMNNQSDFYHNLKRKANNKQNAVIAEIKKASPSKGVLRKDFNPSEIAKSYEQAGASCLSILTDRGFFQGSDEYVIAVAKTTNLPILRKEFIIDAYQIYQAKVIGASAILLIAAILTPQEMQDFYNLATDLGMDVLIEVHNAEELDKTTHLDLKMIGVNNRNLRTFEVDLQTTLDLLPQMSDKLVITESGILSQNDVKLMNNNNIFGFLVGEAFMRKTDISLAYKSLFE